MDTPFNLPLLLPTSPIDLEHELVSGLEQLACAQAFLSRLPPMPTPTQTHMEPALPETLAAWMYPRDGPSSHFNSSSRNEGDDFELQGQQARYQAAASVEVVVYAFLA